MGLARGNHRNYLETLIARKDADNSTFLPDDSEENSTYYKLRGAAQVGNISYIDEILAPYRVSATPNDFHRCVHFTINQCFDDGYKRIALTLAKRYWSNDHHNYILFDKLSGILKGHTLIMQRKVEKTFSVGIVRGSWEFIKITSWMHHALYQSFYKPLFYYDIGCTENENELLDIQSRNGSYIDDELPRWAPLQSLERVLRIILHPTIDRENFCKHIVEPVWGKDAAVVLLKRIRVIDKIKTERNLGNSAAIVLHLHPGPVHMMTRPFYFGSHNAETGQAEQKVLPLEVRQTIMSYAAEHPNPFVIDELCEKVPNHAPTFKSR